MCYSIMIAFSTSFDPSPQSTRQRWKGRRCCDVSLSSRHHQTSAAITKKMLPNIARGADCLAIRFYTYSLMNGSCSYWHHYATIVMPFSANGRDTSVIVSNQNGAIFRQEASEIPSSFQCFSVSESESLNNLTSIRCFCICLTHLISSRLNQKAKLQE